MRYHAKFRQFESQNDRAVLSLGGVVAGAGGGEVQIEIVTMWTGARKTARVILFPIVFLTLLIFLLFLLIHAVRSELLTGLCSPITFAKKTL